MKRLRKILFIGIGYKNRILMIKSENTHNHEIWYDSSLLFFMSEEISYKLFVRGKVCIAESNLKLGRVGKSDSVLSKNRSYYIK